MSRAEVREILVAFVVQFFDKKPTDILQFACEYFRSRHECSLGNIECVGGKKHKRSTSHKSDGSSHVGLTPTEVMGDKATPVNDGNADPFRSPSSPMSDCSPTKSGTPEFSFSDGPDQCVPAVTAGLDPGRKRRRRSVIAEHFDESSIEGFRPPVHEKSEIDIDNIVNIISNIPIFTGFELDKLHELVGSMEIVHPTPNTAIVESSAQNKNFYVVGDGVFQVIEKKGVDKTERTYAKGDFFGELELMCASEERVKIIPRCEGFLWRLDRLCFRKTIYMRSLEERKAIDALLRSVEMLQPLRDEERIKLVDAIARQTFVDKYVIKHGEPGHCMYFVEDGVLEVTIPNSEGGMSKCREYSQGSYFGELALLQDQPRAASVFAKGKVKLLMLDKAAFERLLGPCLEIIKRAARQYSQSDM